MAAHPKLTKDVLQIDAPSLCQKLTEFLREEFLHSKKFGIVVPISGGLDSSVVAALCVRAVGKEKVLGLQLPEHWGNPEANIYGERIARHLGIRTRKINITPILRGLGTYRLYLAALSGRERWKNMMAQHLKKKGQTAEELYQQELQGTLDPASRKLVAKVQAKQRARLLVTYKIAEENQLLVVGAAHKTEQMMGLFVKYGIDDGADLMPLKNLHRSQVLQLGEYLEIPQEILRRTPNPDILPGITDKYQGYFGLNVLQVELILQGQEWGMSPEEMAEELSLEISQVEKVLKASTGSERFRSHGKSPDIGK